MAKTMNAIALYNQSAQRVHELVTVHGWDDWSLFVEWNDGTRSWSPRYIFEHGYDQFACAF